MTGKKTDNQNIEQLNKEIQEWKAKFLRALADYQNLEKRTLQARENDARFAARNLLIKILPVLDALKQAGKNIKDQGLGLIVKQLNEILESENVKIIKVLGEKFDPNLMECLAVEEGENDKVLEELRPGYTIHEDLLRPAQVKVGKKNAS